MSSPDAGAGILGKRRAPTRRNPGEGPNTTMTEQESQQCLPQILHEIASPHLSRSFP
jgi:hypothetical protein